MRMWNVDPKIMCRQHLLGEHHELHMFVGAINRGLNLFGYLNNGMLEIGNIESRHNELVQEMDDRGYFHFSPLDPFPVTQQGAIDKEFNLKDLLGRCERCTERYNNVIDKHEILKGQPA
jgi:hypothetical protein